MKNLFLLLVFSFITFSATVAQELSATVQVNSEQLQSVYKENLENFQAQIEDYLNTTKFSGDNWDWPKIKCSFNIFFTSGTSETNYSAQVVINSFRPIEGTDNKTLMLNIMDSKWSFVYEKNQSIYFNPTDFDPLTSFLDFYAMVIIAMDSDSYEAFGGNPFYQDAMSIAVMGGSSGHNESWGRSSSNYNKRGFIEDATSAVYQQFRKDIFNYHYNGLDVFYRDPEEGYKNIIKLIDDLAILKSKTNRRSPFVNAFFDAKSGEIITYLKDYPDKSIFAKLQKIDPAHISKYIEAEE